MPVSTTRYFVSYEYYPTHTLPLGIFNSLLEITTFINSNTEKYRLGTISYGSIQKIATNGRCEFNTDRLSWANHLIIKAINNSPE